MFSEKEGRGVRSTKIPAQKLSFTSTSTYNDILMAGKDAFFPDYDPQLNSLHIADSSGKVIKSTGDDWTLGKYFEENGFQPSRHKLYIMFKEPLVSHNSYLHFWCIIKLMLLQEERGSCSEEKSSSSEEDNVEPVDQPSASGTGPPPLVHIQDGESTIREPKT